MMMNRILATFSAALGAVVPALAQDYDVVDVEKGNPFLSFVVSLLPYVLLGLFIWFAVWFLARMQRMEQKYDRVIELLEKLLAQRK